MEKQIDLGREARRLVDAAGQQGIPLRLLGGLAVSMRCPSSSSAALKRDYEDIDMATDQSGGRKLADFFKDQGFDPDKELNMLNGHRRQIYYHKEIGKVDIFVGEFEMCHRFSFAGRLNLHPYTIPLADLFLSKAQIVALNRKDLIDLLALLADHPVVGDDEEALDGSYIAGLCTRDWGFFTTVNMTLDRVDHCLKKGEIVLDGPMAAVILDRTRALRKIIDQQPKTLAWKTRSVIGTRQRWYLEVEEVER
jgi:hypothetical protein